MNNSDVETLIKEANEHADIASISNRNGLIQLLKYDDQWMQEEYKLLEISNNLLEELKMGDSITIRGDPDDECVLCTKNETFQVKAADTSNSLLIMPHLNTPKSKAFTDSAFTQTTVKSCFSTYYELRHTRPKFKRLRDYLDGNPFCNEDNDSEKLKLSTAELLETIQSSEVELLQALRKYQAFELEGCWRILKIRYQEKAFGQILALIEENSWDWKSVPLKETCETLNALYPSFVLEQCLEIYGCRKEEGNKRIYSLDEDKVCRYYIEYILRAANGKFNYKEFMSTWTDSIPDGMKVRSDQLLGIALTDMNHHPPVVWHFPERDLPEVPEQRFNSLFRARPKWTHTEIEPYLRDLVGPSQKLSSLLLKFTRNSTNSRGEKVYNSKRPIAS